MPQVLILVAVPALLAYSAASDLVSMTISNAIPLALAAGFALAALWLGVPWQEVAMHIAACLAVLCIGFAMFAFGWIGGGDAKLASAVALWLGWSHLLSWALLSAILGGVLTLLILELRRHPLPAPLQRQAWIDRLHNPTSGVPYGIALSLAALFLLPQTHWFTQLGA